LFERVSPFRARALGTLLEDSGRGLEKEAPPVGTNKTRHSGGGRGGSNAIMKKGLQGARKKRKTAFQGGERKLFLWGRRPKLEKWKKGE